MSDTPHPRSGVAGKLGLALLAGAVCWLKTRHTPSPLTEGGDKRYTGGGTDRAPLRSGRHAGVLWFVVLAGPVLWVIDLMLGYVIAAIGCNANFSGATRTSAVPRCSGTCSRSPAPSVPPSRGTSR